MASTGEGVIEAVKALIAAARPDADVQRNLDTPERIDVETIIIRDGDPGKPEMLMSPLSYSYNHAIRIEMAMPGATQEAREAALDDALISIGHAIEADRTLGGRCDWLEPSTAEKNNMRTEGSETLRIADFDIVAAYSTSNPLT